MESITRRRIAEAALDGGAEAIAADALRIARGFLERFGDRFTRDAADELAQEAAYEAFRRRGTLRRSECWPAFVRTLSRRRRFRALSRHRRRPFESLDADRELQERLIAQPPLPVCVRVAGSRVPIAWCCGEMDSVLRRLDALNASIVRSYYEGFSCSELAQRFGLPVDSVKVRLHRSRQRIRREFESRVRRTGAEVWGP